MATPKSTKATPAPKATAAPKAATPAPTPTMAPKAPPAPVQAQYVVSSKGVKYAPKNGQQANATTWAGILAHIQANGPQTQQQLVQYCSTTFNHGSFANYVIRHSYLQPSS